MEFIKVNVCDRKRNLVIFRRYGYRNGKVFFCIIPTYGEEEILFGYDKSGENNSILTQKKRLYSKRIG